mgnify:FL=1
MFKELYEQVQGRALANPRDRVFLGRASLKRIMKGNLWIEGSQEIARTRHKCFITNRLLESKEEYEAYLDSNFKEEMANKKLERCVFYAINFQENIIGILEQKKLHFFRRKGRN